MLENDKNHLFYGHFLAFSGIFWWFYPCQYGSIGSTFCFTYEDTYYKPHYKLLTPCVYLRLTLYILKNGKNHIFCVLGCWCMTPISTRLMDRWECALWTDDSPIHFPLSPGQNHLCGISTHRLLIKSGSLPPVKHGGSNIMVWAPFILALSCCK